MFRTLLVCLTAALATGCVSMEERKPLALSRGAKDLNCGKEQLAVEQIGHRLFTVSGCGQQATYRVICKLTVGSCYLLEA